MSDLRTFLLAQIAADEEAAKMRQALLDAVPEHERSAAESVRVTLFGGESWLLATRAPDPARVLADCGAKRAIVDRHRQYAHTGFCECCFDDYPCADLRTLGAVYDQHPDHREEWRP